MTDARRRAEEALALPGDDPVRKWAVFGCLHQMISEIGEEKALRSLLAEAPAPPAADEVREAAKRVEAALPAVRRYQRVPLPLSSDHAAMAPGACECRWHATDGLLWSVDSLLAALDARGGA